MKFICLRYLDRSKWVATPEAERRALLDECYAYDEILRDSGHFLAGEELRGTGSAVALRCRNRQIAVTDGTLSESPEQLGGLLLLEARDLNHAIALMAKHPGVRAGAFEIHVVDSESDRSGETL